MAWPGFLRVALLQLTETWGDRLFGALARAGGKAYSNMAVGFNNVDVDAASRHGIAVGNTPVHAPLHSTAPQPPCSLDGKHARSLCHAEVEKESRPQLLRQLH